MSEQAAVYEVNRKEAEKAQDMQQVMLRKFLGQQVMIHLVSGIRLTGRLTAHDRYTIVLDARQLIFKHAISTISNGERRT